MAAAERQWEIVFKADIVAVEKNRGNGFERAVRSPGVRLILSNGSGWILLTKEFRPEQGRHDFRLPGGKVFDDLDSYLAARGDAQAVLGAVMEAGKAEAKQEAGVEEIGGLSLLSRSVAGTTIEWDLYYLAGTALKMGKPELLDDEAQDLAGAAFYPKEEVLRMLQAGDIAEDRSAAVLFRYLAAPLHM